MWDKLVGFLRNKEVRSVGRAIGFLSFFIIPVYLPFLFGSHVISRIVITQCISDEELSNKSEEKRVFFDKVSPKITEDLRKQLEDVNRLSSVFQVSNEFMRYEMLLKNRTHATLIGVGELGKSERYNLEQDTIARCLVDGKEVNVEPSKKTVLLSGLKLSEDIDQMTSSISSCLREIGHGVQNTSGKDLEVENIELKGCVDLIVKPDRQSFAIAYLLLFSGWIAIIFLLKKGPIKFFLEGLTFFKDSDKKDNDKD